MVSKAKKLKSSFYSSDKANMRHFTIVQYHRKLESFINAMEAVEWSAEEEPCVVKQVAVSHGQTLSSVTTADYKEA